MVENNNKKRNITIDLGKEGKMNYEIDRDSPFESWPMPVKLECLNCILILYNVRLITEKTYVEKYQKYFEKYDCELQELLQFS
ncbi:hypothetical protein NEF87_004836 [Candidatus Lokiarchaeum ossiferum]|uniref:Uncharacterized protein n=1 Tax=Candidatus Lokiarchaeum ossiferum TaxID=2951803 RepID=A0ABY6HYD9_9ARCH|nr:hypothetical protein NEF87_004836 [Candidatus Lokiarchaeum sp. B-35]